MAGAKIGDKVKFHYAIKDEKGKTVDRTKDDEPEEIILGEGSIPAGIEVSLVGMNVGETKTVALKPNMHYGERIEEMQFDVDRDQFPKDMKLDKGEVVEFGFEDGTAGLFTIVKMGDKMVTIDGNHPLAGREITCELKVTDIEASS